MGLLSTILTVFLALIGTPLFIVLAFSSLIFLHFNGIDLTAMVIELYKLAHTPMLVALPLFSLAGYVLAPVSFAAKSDPSWVSVSIRMAMFCGGIHACR